MKKSMLIMMFVACFVLFAGGNVSAQKASANKNVDIWKIDPKSLPPNPESDFRYSLDKSGTGVVVEDYNGKSDIVVIPAEIEGFPVKRVRTQKICYREWIRALIFKDGIDSIDPPAFGVDAHLEYISLPSTLKEIPDRMFSGCYYLVRVDIPEGIESIRGRLFEHSSIKTLVLPSTIKSIERAAFRYSSLESITLPANLETIKSEAFSESKITSIVIPDNVVEIEELAFFQCKSLKSVTLSSSIKKIGVNAFYACDSLEELIIPENFSAEIDDFAFSSTKLPLKTQAQLRKLGYQGSF